MCGNPRKNSSVLHPVARRKLFRDFPDVNILTTPPSRHINVRTDFRAILRRVGDGLVCVVEQQQQQQQQHHHYSFKCRDVDANVMDSERLASSSRHVTMTSPYQSSSAAHNHQVIYILSLGKQEIRLQTPSLTGGHKGGRGEPRCLPPTPINSFLVGLD